MKKIFLIGFFSVAALGFAQRVGIGTTSPNSTVDIVAKSSNVDSKSFHIKNTDQTTLIAVHDNGDVSLGSTTTAPVAQFTIFGKNNEGIASEPALNVTYPNNPQHWGIYINPQQGDINPALPGYFNFYMDNDGIMNQYSTPGNYGSFFGHHASGFNSGIFFAENGTTVLSTYRPDYSSTALHYLTTTPIGFYISGSARLEDEQKGYTEGGNCTNPGVIAYDSANSNFLGCAEIYDAAGNNTGTMIWKKLNNN